MDSIASLFSGKKSEPESDAKAAAGGRGEALRKRNLLAMAKGRGGARTGTLGNPDIVQAGLTSAKSAKTGG